MKGNQSITEVNEISPAVCKNQEMRKSLNQMKANQTIPEVNEISMHQTIRKI